MLTDTELAELVAKCKLRNYDDTQYKLSGRNLPVVGDVFVPADGALMFGTVTYVSKDVVQYRTAQGGKYNTCPSKFFARYCILEKIN